MKKVFLDTNIVLDLLMKREEFYEDAKEIFYGSGINKYVFIYHHSHFQI